MWNQSSWCISWDTIWYMYSTRVSLRHLIIMDVVWSHYLFIYLCVKLVFKIMMYVLLTWVCAMKWTYMTIHTYRHGVWLALIPIFLALLCWVLSIARFFKDFVIFKVMLFVTWLTLFVLPKNEWLHSLKLF